MNDNNPSPVTRPQPTASAGDVEPMEFGAVVTDADGLRWVRTSEGRVPSTVRPWLSDEIGPHRIQRWKAWADIPAPTLLADVRREERERVLGEVERAILAADTGRGGALVIVRDLVREARGGAR